MFKKIIYSVMALSLTMLPASEVMAAVTLPSTGGTIESDSDSVTINTTTGSSAWTGGTIVNTGGTLTISGITQGSFSGTVNYQQSDNGVLVIRGTDPDSEGGAAGAFTLAGTGTTNMASISGGTISVGQTSNTYATLTLGQYSSIASAVDLGIIKGASLVINGTGATATITSADTWDGNVTLANGKLTINSGTIDHATVDEGQLIANGSTYTQTGGTLEITNGATLNLDGSDGVYQHTISGGTVNVGTSGSSGTLRLGQGAKISADVTVNIAENGTVNLTGQQGGSTPSLVLNAGDTWNGTINNTKIYSSESGRLELNGYSNKNAGGNSTAVYTQDSGSSILQLTNGAELQLDTASSYISDGEVMIGTTATDTGNSLIINKATTATGKTATLGETALLTLNKDNNLVVQGTGTAVIDNTSTGMHDSWDGNVILTDGELTLRNVQKNFVDPNAYDDDGNITATDTAKFVQSGGKLNIESGSYTEGTGGFGGSQIVINNVYGYNSTTGEYHNTPEEGDTAIPYLGTMNVSGGVYEDSTSETGYTVAPSQLVINYLTSDDITTGSISQKPSLSMSGYGTIALNTNGYELDFINDSTNSLGFGSLTQKITGTGAGNNLFVVGTDTTSGRLTITDVDSEVSTIGANVTVQNAEVNVIADSFQVGINDGSVTSYGNLNLENSTFNTYSTNNVIVGNLTLTDSWYNHANTATTSVGGNLTTGSGMDLMNGGYDRINVAGDTTINNLELKIDVNPTTLQTDTIHTSGNVYENGTLNLSDYSISTTDLRKDFYRFNVLTTDGTYNKGSGANKIVTGDARRIIHTKIANYQMFASPADGAFDMRIVSWNPEVFRGQVAADVIYANQQVINNQLFDRMVYSILPYFNAKCANKTAAADTMYSPYQYTMSDPGLWFKPYANFETIHMTHGLGKVRNNAYGAMIGADFQKAEWGNWTFIPSAYIGYNGGHTTYSGVGMWHNGGQAGFMGTLTNNDFVTMFNVYGGGYGNSMDVGGYKDKNALWNAGIGSKTAYNIHLPWDFILQPTLYMAYSYVGASSWTSKYDGFKHKVNGLNAFSVAPGLNLIWQKETFSLYATFQAMFNVGSTVKGRVAEIGLPHVGIRDPYFEYGLGASKYFLDRFSGYGQVTARSGSRKGVGFQLGLNMKI